MSEFETNTSFFEIVRGQSFNEAGEIDIRVGQASTDSRLAFVVAAELSARIDLMFCSEEEYEEKRQAEREADDALERVMNELEVDYSIDRPAVLRAVEARRTIIETEGLIYD